jgi:hypothetical protein
MRRTRLTRLIAPSTQSFSDSGRARRPATGSYCNVRVVSCVLDRWRAHPSRGCPAGPSATGPHRCPAGTPWQPKVTQSGMLPLPNRALPGMVSAAAPDAASPAHRRIRGRPVKIARALCSSPGSACLKIAAGIVAVCSPRPLARMGRMLCAVLDARSIRVAAAALRHDSHRRARRHHPGPRCAGGIRTRSDIKPSPPRLSPPSLSPPPPASVAVTLRCRTPSPSSQGRQGALRPAAPARCSESTPGPLHGAAIARCCAPRLSILR